MKGWLDDNPKNRKTSSGIRRFINNWLSREQDKAPRDRKNYTNANRFINYEQGKTDWNAVADKIMQQEVVQ